MSNAPAAGHAVDLLTLLAAHPEPMPAAAIARDLGLPRSTTYHLLTVLVDRGFVVHVPEDRRYGLGPAAYELGSAYQRQAPLQRVSRAALTRLAERTTHNAHLAVLHGRDVLYVVEERAPGRPLLVTDVGVRLPAALTASGLAMLAALPGRQITALYPDGNALVQRDGRGFTSVTALRRELAATRQRGYATEAGTVTPGLASVAHAVLDHTGHPVAGVAATFPAETPAEEVAAVEAAVRTTARDVSHRLGHRGSAAGGPQKSSSKAT